MAELAKRVERVIKKKEKKALLGLASISPVEFQELVNEFKQMLRNPAKFNFQQRYYLTTMTLIGFNMYYFTGQRYWEELDTYLDFNNATVLRKECVHYFKNYCRRNSIRLYETPQMIQYRESIQMHTILAQHQFSKFIQVLIGLYMKDLEEDTSDEVVLELLRYLHKIFKQYDGQEEITSEYRGSKMSLTNQQLPKSFKKAFMLNFSSVGWLMKRYFTYLEALRMSQPITFRPGNYYDKLFQNHLAEINKQLEKEAIISKHAGGGGQKQFRRPFYRLQDTSSGLQISLIVPKQLISPSDISDELKVTFWQDSNKVKEDVLEANPGTLFWKTFQREFLLNDFYPRLSYTITSKDSPIYDSGRNLMSSFLLFNAQGEQIAATQLKNNETYFLIAEDDAEVETYETTSEHVYREHNYLRYELIFNENTEIRIDGILLSTSFKEQPDGFPSSTKYAGVSILSEDTEYYLIKSASSFYFTCSKGESLADYQVVLNGKTLTEEQLADMSQRSLLGDGTGRTRYIINFDSLMIDGELTQEIRIQRKGMIPTSFKRNYILVNDLEWRFEKDFYTREASAEIVQLYSENLQLKLDSKSNLKVAVKRGFYRQSFHFQGKEFWIEVSVPVISVRAYGDNSDLSLKERYFHNDFPYEQLTLSIPGQSFEMFCTMNTTVKKMHIKRNGTLSQVNLKPFLSGRQADIHRFSIKLNEKFYPLFDVHFEECVETVEVRYTDPNKLIGGLSLSGEYLGDSELCLDIFQPGGELQKSYTNVQLPFHDPRLDLLYEIYQVELYTKVPSFFGDEDERKVLHAEELIYGDKFVLKNRFRRAQTVEAISLDGQFATDRLFFEGFGFDSYQKVYKAKAFFFKREWETGREKKVYLDENPINFQNVIPSGNHYLITPTDANGELMVIDVQSKKINPREANFSHDYDRYKVIENLIIRII